MKIRELIPKHKEIIIPPSQAGKEKIILDAFSYVIENPPTNGGAREKKYLYVLSQVKTTDPSLDYIPNLIASFIKREFETASQNTLDDEKIFETSLKKTNELIESLLEKNKIELELGVAFINKERILLSKIGKAKMLLSRPGLKKNKPNGLINVFENITEFNKIRLKNKEFSNIIAGEIADKDKFLFLIPNPHLSLRQRVILSNFTGKSQDEFIEKIKEMKEKNKGKKPLYCCGIHLEIEEKFKQVSEEKPKEKTGDSQKEEPQINSPIAAEVSKIPRENTFGKMGSFIKSSVLGQGSSALGSKRFYGPAVIVLIGLIILTGAIIIIRQGDNQIKKEAAAINEKIKLGESKLILKQDYEARGLIKEAINEVNALKESGEKKELLASAYNLFIRLEKINDSVKPELIIDFSKIAGLDPNPFKNILAKGEKIFVSDSDKIYELKNNGAAELAILGEHSLIEIKGEKIAAYGPGIKILNTITKETVELRKRFNFEPIDLDTYEDNLYFLGQNEIYKISNALIKPINEFGWLKEDILNIGNFIAFDLNSSIYVITDSRKLATFYKGKLMETKNLGFDVGAGTELVNLAGDEFLVTDKNQKIARVLDSAGNVKVSYNLSGTGEVKDTYFDKENLTLYILSPAGIWRLKI